MSSEPRWALDDVLRHRVGSEWKLVEHVGGPEDDWIAECVASNRRPWFDGKVGERKLFHREYMDRAFVRIRRCPDGGACHHKCLRTECYRVQTCTPLSDYGEEWSVEDLERFAGSSEKTVLPMDTVVSMLVERELTCRANAGQEDLPDERRVQLTAMADAYEDAAALVKENLPSVGQSLTSAEPETSDPITEAIHSRLKDKSSR